MDTRDKALLWKSKVEDEELSDQLAELLSPGKESALDDAFFQDLAFGTAGLRGVIGAGTNRMNIYTVGKATQGLAEYLNATFDNPSVAIARDSRHKGKLFEQTVAGVLAANGIRSHIYPRIEPTPALSFAVRDLSCSAGICLTASHNPAAYNGYKVYGPDGCQITSDAAVAIQKAIDGIDEFSDVLTMPFPQAIEEGWTTLMDEGTLERFLDAVQDQDISSPEGKDVDLNVVYTPLNGTGLECVTQILHRIGVDDITLVESQKDPDGSFPTCPYPNPEIKEALQEGIAVCRSVHPDVLLATDPDADRVGIAVEDGGEIRLLSGNETGVLLLDYIGNMRSELGLLPNNAIAVTTIVSTVMVDDLAKTYGFEIERVLTGFKYIGEVIGRLEKTHQENRFIFGFEESYGYLSGPHVRDKDAVNASMLICEMTRYWKSKGMNLAQAIESLYERYGYYRNRTISLSFDGADGSLKMAQIMARLREKSPESFADMPVESSIDYQTGYANLPKANVLEYRLPNTCKVIIRPSGTEPKIKAYLFSRGSDEAAGDEILDTLEASARKLLD